MRVQIATDPEGSIIRKMTKRPHILLTNDDGIYAPGIYALYQTLSAFATVTVVAPDSERSSVGHAITLAHPIWQRKVTRKGKPFGYGISGTPADCVKFGTYVILKRKKPDLVVSGINQGRNDGCSVFYSGTVAGAREGALMGIPSMAVSLDSFIDQNFAQAAKAGAHVAKRILKYGLNKGTFLNVNVPNKPVSQIKGYLAVRQGLKPIHGMFRKRRDPNMRDYYWMTGKHPATTKDTTTDTDALNHDYVTIVPVHCDLTDYQALSDLKDWSF